VKSGYAVSPTWKSEPLRITGSSPVLGRDAAGAEVIYVGTTDATLVAVDAPPGGALERSLGSPGVISASSHPDSGRRRRHFGRQHRRSGAAAACKAGFTRWTVKATTAGPAFPGRLYDRSAAAFTFSASPWCWFGCWAGIGRPAFRGAGDAGCRRMGGTGGRKTAGECPAVVVIPVLLRPGPCLASFRCRGCWPGVT